MTYYAAKMSFIKRSEGFFTEEATTEPPIVLAEKAIMEAPVHVKSPKKIRSKRKVKGVIDFYITDVLDDRKRLIAFRVSKKRLRPKGELSEKKIIQIEEEHFSPSTILWSAASQTIFIEKPKKDQMSVKSIINNLISYLNSRLVVYGYIVLIAQLPYKSSFWRMVEEYDIKYSVEFILFAPNFLETSDWSRKLAEGNKRDFDATKTSIKISNEEGHLQIPRNNELINDCLERITNGAGKWIARVGIGKRRKSISSETNSKALDKDLPEYNAETAKNFTCNALELLEETETQKGKEQ